MEALSAWSNVREWLICGISVEVPARTQQGSLSSFLFDGFTSHLRVSGSPWLLPRNAEASLARAREAANRTHCPYSAFLVGAAARCDDGSVIEDCNVENAIYGLSICPEEVALFTAISQGKRTIESGRELHGMSRAMRRLPSGDAGTSAQQGHCEHRWFGDKTTQ